MKRRLKFHQRGLLSTLAAANSYADSQLVDVGLSYSHERLQEVLERLDSGFIQGNPTTYARLLRACGRMGVLSELKRVHHHIVRSGLDQDPSLGSHLVQMYLRCDSLTDAQRTFDGLASKPGVVLWTALIAGYAKNRHCKEAIRLFEEMQRKHVIPDKITFVTVLNAFDRPEMLAEAKAIHARICESGYDTDVVVGNALVNMYANCNSLENAWQVFDRMQHRDVVSWTAMVAAYAKNGHFDEAMLLFRQMQVQGVAPNKVTFLAILSSCESLTEGMAIHARVVASGLGSDVAVSNAVLNMYANCGDLENARKLFNDMLQRNTVSWTAMIAAYVKCGDCGEALQLFREMQDEMVMPDRITFITILNGCTGPADLAEARWIHGCIIRSGFESDVVVGNAIINTYGKCGSLKEAYRTFTSMEQRDHVSWTAMITAYSERGRLKRAFHLFREMQLEGFMPNEVTLITVINACALSTALKEGTIIHSYVTQRGLDSNFVIATALVKMYGKTGSLDNAYEIFTKLRRQDVVVWTAMVAAYAQHGDSGKASKLFRLMQQEGTKPVDVTFVSIISACSHAGLVENGCDFFATMIKDHCIAPMSEHYGCMVDLFGRAGWLAEAEYLIDSMPCNPTPMVWMAFLGACKTHGDIQRGQRAAAHILGLNSRAAAAAVALSNTYAASGREDDAGTLRTLIAEGSLDKHCQGLCTASSSGIWKSFTNEPKAFREFHEELHSRS